MEIIKINRIMMKTQMSKIKIKRDKTHKNNMSKWEKYLVHLIKMLTEMNKSIEMANIVKALSKICKKR
jgi:hypothetical protein